MTVENEGNCTVTIYLACGAVVGQRVHLNLDPENDGKRMAAFGMAYITNHPIMMLC